MKKYFPTPINSTDEFFERLEKEGKVTLLNKPEDYEAQKRMNELIDEGKRPYRSMDAGSIAGARECYIFC